jgi:endonuclease/exonuclease/phosphatase (EEP) superfamily protein YafD
MFETIASAISIIGAIVVAICAMIIYIVAQIISPEYSGSGSVSTEKYQTQPRRQYTILTFNVEYEAENYSPGEVVELIESLGADIAVLNEAHPREGAVTDHADHTSKIADALSLAGINHVYSHDWAVIASTLPIVQPYRDANIVSTDIASNKYIKTAALIDDKFYMISVHLTDYPYQPFQLAHIPYCADTCQRNICSRPYKWGENVASSVNTVSSARINPHDCKAEEEMIAAAQSARGAEIDDLITAIEFLRAIGKPIFLAGDFNEPSHLDWSNAAVVAGQQPVVVRFPASSRLAAAGMTDLFRAVHPDPVTNPGYTWPARPLTAEELADASSGQVQEQISTPTDRIDFIYGRGCRATAANVVVTPSDHNAVVAEVELE